MNLVNTTTKKTSFILPRFIRFRDAPSYLGMNRNAFNQVVRPFVTQLPIGKQGIAFDRLDLDEWAEQYKHRVARPEHSRGELWDENDKSQERQGYYNEASIGPLTRKSLDDEYEKLLGPLPTRKPKQSWRVVLKTRGKQ